MARHRCGRLEVVADFRALPLHLLCLHDLGSLLIRRNGVVLGVRCLESGVLLREYLLKFCCRGVTAIIVRDALRRLLGLLLDLHVLLLQKAQEWLLLVGTLRVAGREGRGLARVL